MWAAIPFIMHFKGQGLTTPPPSFALQPPPPPRLYRVTWPWGAYCRGYCSGTSSRCPSGTSWWPSSIAHPECGGASECSWEGGGGGVWWGKRVQ